MIIGDSLPVNMQMSVFPGQQILQVLNHIRRKNRKDDENAA